MWDVSNAKTGAELTLVWKMKIVFEHFVHVARLAVGSLPAGHSSSAVRTGCQNNARIFLV